MIRRIVHPFEHSGVPLGQEKIQGVRRAHIPALTAQQLIQARQAEVRTDVRRFVRARRVTREDGRQVADLAGVAGEPCVGLPVDDDASAKSAADVDVKEGPELLPRAV